MKQSLMLTAIMTAALCGTTLAQTTTPSSADPSTPPEQPQAQPAQPSMPQQQQTAPTAATAGNQTPSTNAVRIAPGSVIPVLLANAVDAKKVKTGDEVVAKVAQDMKSSTGEVIVPKDTKIVGHVTEAQARSSKEQKESQVGIAFDKVVLKDQEVSLPMSIQAVIGQQQSNDAGGGESQGAAAPAPGAPSGSMAGGRNSGATAAQPQTSPATSATGDADDHPQHSGAHPPINGNTQGVVGISNLKLETAQNAAQGSVLSSEKNNVKLEGGTFMLLRVGQ